MKGIGYLNILKGFLSIKSYPELIVDMHPKDPLSVSGKSTDGCLKKSPFEIDLYSHIV